MSEKNNGTLEKIDVSNQKTWSPPEITHLTEISETSANGGVGGDLVFEAS